MKYSIKSISFLAIPILFGGLVSSVLAQEESDDSSAALDPVSYYGFESTKFTSSSGFNLFGDRPHDEPDVETDEVSVVYYGGAPAMGQTGLSWGYRTAVHAGVQDSDNVNIGYLGDDGSLEFGFNGELTYEEQYRVTATTTMFFSFNRFHPYLQVGGYYADGSDATMVGEIDAGPCRGNTVDAEVSGTTWGWTWGGGMLVNITPNLAFTASYEVHDNVDFDFELECIGDMNPPYTIASFDSKIESYGVGLVYSF